MGPMGRIWTGKTGITITITIEKRTNGTDGKASQPLVSRKTTLSGMVYFRMSVEVMIRIGGQIGNAGLDCLLAHPKRTAFTRHYAVAARLLGLDVNGGAVREGRSWFQHHHIAFDCSAVNHDVSIRTFI